MATKKKTMTSNVQATAMAIAGRAARACDVCGIQRACWYCAADEAYLCAKCDTAVHAANALALRHARVRLVSHGVPFPKSFERSSSSVSSKHSKNGRDAGASASPSVLIIDQVKQLHFSQAHTRAAPPSTPDILDSKVLVAQHCQLARDRFLPSRKRSRTTRPHPHHLRNATGGGGRDPSYKIQKSSKDEGMVQVKIKSISDFMVSDLDLMMNDDEASKKRFEDGAAHEVPTFITVVRDRKNSEISPGFNPGFVEAGHSASPDSFSPIFKGKAAQAYAQDDLSDDADQYLVPDYFNNCLDSGVDVCCDVDGTISLVEDASAKKEEENIAAVVNEVKTFSSEAQLIANFGASTEVWSTNFGSPDVGLLRELKDSTEIENYRPPQLSDPSLSAKSLPGSVKLESPSSGHDTERVKTEGQEILRCSLEALTEEGLRQVPCLRLDYEDVLDAWSDREAFWIDPQGARLLNALGSTAAAAGRRMGEEEVIGVVPVPNVRGDPRRGEAAPCAVAEAGKQARVLRYKEKRLTRLFSKTIRYQVRKLNAERRPRMKGRFVKSSNSASS